MREEDRDKHARFLFSRVKESRAHALTPSGRPEGFLTLIKKTDECRSGIFSVNFRFRDKHSTIIAMIFYFVIFSVFCGRIARGKELGNEINKA